MVGDPDRIEAQSFGVADVVDDPSHVNRFAVVRNADAEFHMSPPVKAVSCWQLAVSRINLRSFLTSKPVVWQQEASFDISLSELKADG
jgi:hypothetical protein